MRLFSITKASILLFMLLFSFSIFSKALAENRKKANHFYNDSIAVQSSRAGLADIIRFMQSRADLFPGKKIEQKRLLKRNQRMAIWQAWQAFLDHLLILDSLGQEYESIVYDQNGDFNKQAFRIGFAIFLAQYRYALDFINISERDPSMHVLLNEPVPEIGLPQGSYSKVKFRFLNVLRGMEFARLCLVYKLYNGDKKILLTPGIKDDMSKIWDTGKGRGPAQTARNAIKIIQDTGFTTWFPVQKGISQWMGDTKVWRPHKSLITFKQIQSMEKLLEPGDIILTRREWYLSNIGLPGFWPHGALYIGTPHERNNYFNDSNVHAWIRHQKKIRGDFEDLLKQSYPKAYALSNGAQDDGHKARIIEAVGEGVSFTTLEHSASADSLAILRPRLSKISKARAILRGFHYSGRPYDFNFDFLTDSELVCTELIYKAYEKTEKIKGLNFPVISVLGRPVTPANEMVRLFDQEYQTLDQQLNLVLFLDGHEKNDNAEKADVSIFRETWKRPKWHIFIQEIEKSSD